MWVREGIHAREYPSPLTVGVKDGVAALTEMGELLSIWHVEEPRGRVSAKLAAGRRVYVAEHLLVSALLTVR